MTSVVAWLIATVVTAPLFAWYIIYIAVVKWKKNKAFAVRIASDGTTVIFMAACYFIMHVLWGRSLLWLILFIFFFIAFIFTYFHWKIAKDIYINKLLKGIWRFNFLVFFFLYLFLSSYGLILKIVTS